MQADITLVEADELDCTGQALSLITGRAHAGGHPQLPRLRELLSRSKRSLILAPNRETVSLFSTCLTSSACQQPWDVTVAHAVYERRQIAYAIERDLSGCAPRWLTGWAVPCRLSLKLQTGRQQQKNWMISSLGMQVSENPPAFIGG